LRLVEHQSTTHDLGAGSMLLEFRDLPSPGIQLKVREEKEFNPKRKDSSNGIAELKGQLRGRILDIANWLSLATSNLPSR
jgi:hypothetical protein